MIYLLPPASRLLSWPNIWLCERLFSPRCVAFWLKAGGTAIHDPYESRGALRAFWHLVDGPPRYIVFVPIFPAGSFESTRSVGRSVDWPVGRSVGRSVARSVGRSVSRANGVVGYWYRRGSSAARSGAQRSPRSIDGPQAVIPGDREPAGFDLSRTRSHLLRKLPIVLSIPLAKLWR